MKANGEKTEPPATPGGEVTLTAFVKGNYPLLATIGIFVALTVFSQSIRLKAIGNLLSFLFLSCAVLVMFEIFTQISTARYSGRLKWFGNILSLAILTAIMYWLLEFRTIWRAFLWLPLAGIPMTLTAWMLTRPKVLRVLAEIVPEKTRIIPPMILSYLVAFGLVVLSAYIGLKLSDPVNDCLDGLRRVLEKLPGQ